jgi:tRNA (guanine-N7-)-methyltransferase
MLRPIKSYVIRAGRISGAQKRAYEQLFSRYASKQTDKIPFQNLFDVEQPVVLEIGFGMGQALIHHAKLHPELNFIGIEVHPPGVGSLLHMIAQENLNNIRIIQGDAVLALKEQCLDTSLHSIHIFFPDPWPKKRHHKRRLIQTELMNSLAQKLKAGGVLHLATDWQPYADHMRSVVTENSHFKKINEQRGARPLTKFEHKGLRQGHQVTDLQYQKL